MKNKKAFILFTLIAMIFSGFVSVNDSHSAPEASIFCRAMGSNMGRHTIDRNVIKPDDGHRKWTVQEVFSKGVKYSTYYGEGKGNLVYPDKIDRGKKRAEEAWNAPGVQSRLESASNGPCFPTDFIPNIVVSLSSTIVNMINSLVGYAIGSNELTEGLVNIIGGKTDSDSGLIGIFLNSIYMPLVVIAALFLAVTIIYKGLIQMKFREAIMSAIWSLGAFIIGLTLMFNPKMLVRIPQAATNTITTCVMGAMSGQNCLSEDVLAPSIVTGHECRSEIIDGDNDIETAVNSMNCTIWKTFVLEPWAEEQFGEPYSHLYTKNEPEGGKIWSNLPEEKEDLYCVNLASTRSASGSGTSVHMNKDAENTTICNVALYQLYLKADMVDSVNQNENRYKLVSRGKTPMPIDERWYDIIVPMATSSSHWDSWVGGGQSLISRFMSSLLSLIAVIAASFVLIPLSIFAGAYKVIGVILMAFSPLFLLFAVEPTRGRKIFLGWLETVVSSILKYFAIILLMVVSLMLYAGVLSATKGFASSFVSVIVLTAAIRMYRKEIVDLIGASNMGGERLSNKTNEVLEKAGDKAKRASQAVVGGAVGGSIANLSARRTNKTSRENHLDRLREELNKDIPEDEKDDIRERIAREEAAIDELGGVMKSATKGGLKGAKDTSARMLKRGTSATALAFKQGSETKRKLEQGQKGTNKTHDYERELFDSRNEARKKRSEGNPNDKTQENMENYDYEGNDISYRKDMSTSAIERDKMIQRLRPASNEVNYSGDLSSDELSSLDNFATELKKMTDDGELAEMSNNKEVALDPNKRKLVANELNARIALNTINGKASGELSRHELASPENLSDEELRLNMDIHRENYMETGSQLEYDKLDESYKEIVKRGGIPFAERKELKDTMDNTKIERAVLEETDKKYVRNENVPTSEEANKDPEKYVKKVTAPQEIVETYKRKEEDEAKFNEKMKEIEKETNDNNKETPGPNEPPRKETNDNNKDVPGPNEPPRRDTNDNNKDIPGPNEPPRRDTNDNNKDIPGPNEPPRRDTIDETQDFKLPEEFNMEEIDISESFDPLNRDNSSENTDDFN